MALKSMQLTPEEAKDEYACAPTSDGDAPKYPYGLTLCLGDEALAKLGVQSLPAVGTRVLVLAEAYVSGISMRERQGGKRTQDVDIQLTALDLQPAPMSADPAQALFGKGQGQ